MKNCSSTGGDALNTSCAAVGIVWAIMEITASTDAIYSEVLSQMFGCSPFSMGL